MKSVALCVLLCLVAVARGQLQYEQAAYTDAAAPAPFEQELAPAQDAVDVQNSDEVDSDAEADAEMDEAESSFAEMSDEDEGPFTDMAKKTRKHTRTVKNLFKKRKDQGGNISPSRNGRPAPAPKAKHHHRKGRKAEERKERKERKDQRKHRKHHKGGKGGKDGAGSLSSLIGGNGGKRSESGSGSGSVSNKRAKAIARKAAAAGASGSKAALKGGKGSESGKRMRKPIIAPKKHRKGGKPSPRAARKQLKKKLSPRRKPIAMPRPPAAARGSADDLWHYERHTPPKSENRDPEMAKLNLALEAVKENILLTNKQINDERRWVIAVGKIITSYNTKMKRVEAHIIALRKEMKALYRKKKQIENLKLQRALEAKLKEAKAELATLTHSLKHVAVKQGELNKSGRDLRLTIAGIQGQLAKLRGQHMFKKCKAGTKFSKKAKKCVSKCKKGSVYAKKSKKCVARCKKGSKWNSKSRKCIKGKGKKGKGKGKGRK